MNFREYFRNRKRNRKQMEAQGLLDPKPGERPGEKGVTKDTVLFESSTGTKITYEDIGKRGSQIKANKARRKKENEQR